MKKIVFLGSKQIGYECLKYVLERSQELQIVLVAALTKVNKLDDPQKNITQLCQQEGIPILPELDDLLSLEEVDMLISVQYHLILKPQHIQKAQQIAVNLHMAPLPEYRGCNQFSFAILDDAKTFGTTIHVLDESIDSGDILFEKRFPIPPDCFVGELYKMTLFHSIDLFKSSLANLVKGNYEPISQQSLIPERGVSYHYRKEINRIKELSIEWDKEKIAKHIRATYFPPFPPPFFYVNGKKFNIQSPDF